jgi:hypothetical protein
VGNGEGLRGGEGNEKKGKGWEKDKGQGVGRG